MGAKAKVVITDYVWESLDVEKATLGALADLVPMKTKKPEEFIDAAQDCDALLNTYAGPITAEVMARMPKCRIIARYGIGVDTIDLEAATRAGIIVTNNPTYCIEEVAEHTMALLFACARKVALYDRLGRAGRWEVPPGKPMFRLEGRTLGLVGFGNIARQVAVRATAFGMRVLFADPFVKEGQFDIPARKVELDALLRDADFVSVHPPLTPQTRKMINDDAFSKMKPTAFLVNCSRGPVVDTEALVLRARHHGPGASPRPASVAQSRQCHHHAARRVVQRAGDGRATSGSAQRSAPRADGRMARECREPRSEGKEPRGALIWTP